MLKKLNSPWISSVVGLLCFLGVTAATWNAATRTITTAKEAHLATNSESVTVELPGANVEAEALIKELREERQLLDRREKDLNELAARLNAERDELIKLTNAVSRMQKDFDSSVSRVTDEEVTNLKKLAKTYSAMEVEGAANIFKQMDDTSVVKVMLFMKEQETGPILASLAKLGETDAKRAADLTEKLRVAVAPKKK